MIKTIEKKYSVDEILKFVKFTGTRVESDKIKLDGNVIYINSPYLQNLAKNGVVCEKCGCTGEYFLKKMEVNTGRNINGVGQYYTLKLYAVKDNKEVLMVKSRKNKDDKSKDINNCMTLCEDCLNIENRKVD